MFQGCHGYHKALIQANTERKKIYINGGGFGIGCREAVVLSNVEVETIAEALFSIFFGMGFPI